MSIKAGELRHRIRFERYTAATDSSGVVIQDPVTGETTRDWVPIVETWAAIRPLSAREFLAAQALQGEVTGKVVCRQRNGIDTQCRIVHLSTQGNVIYAIKGPPIIDPESGLEWMTILVSQGVTDGD